MQLLQKNIKQTICGIALCILYACSLAGCGAEPAAQPILLSSSSHSELTESQTLRIPLLSSAQPLLIEVLARNVKHRSEVLDNHGQIISKVQLDFLRSAPVYHLIDATPVQADYTLEVTPMHSNQRASITVKIYALPAVSESDATLASAWRDLAKGLQQVDGEAAEDWAGSLAALSRAQQSFDRLQLKEPALWALYFSAYIKYYPLYQYADALTSASTLIASGYESGVPLLSLLGHQLAGQIQIERDAGNDETQARQNLQEALQHFTAARQLAEQSDNTFEIVWAINNAGITLYYQDEISDALDQYALALEMAIQLQDTYLVNLIGGNTAVAQERLGYTDKAVETLLRLLREQGIQNDPIEREHLLSLLGQYYLKLYRFPEALDVLNQALELGLENQWVESRGRNRLLLGQAYRQLGQADKSLALLQLALPDLEAAHDGRGMRRALALSADISRLQQHFSKMRHDRARQEDYLATDTGRADWLQSQARDAAAEARFELAISLYRQSGELYALSSFEPLAQLARLNACVIEMRLRAGSGCSSSDLAAAYGSIQSMQASTLALEGHYLWAQLFALEGKHQIAGKLLADLVDEINFYRHELPGVLGAWYWDARRQIFEDYMKLELDPDTANEQTAVRSFLALDRVRNASFNYANQGVRPARENPQHQATATFRSLLAKRSRAKSAEARIAAQNSIDQLLLSHALDTGTINRQPTAAEFRQQLGQLPPDWSVLTFYFTDQMAYAWTGNSDGLKLHQLGSGIELRQLIEKARDNIRTINHASLDQDLVELGDRLLAPIQHDLRFRVLFINAGALSDFPLEALPVAGQALVRQHQLVNVASANHLEWLTKNLERPFRPDSIFLAGNPAFSPQGPQELRGAASELATVQAYFPAAMTTVRQGNELSRSAFDSPALDSADLIHIASHATIDTEYPELSRLALSNDADIGEEFLTPSDFVNRQFSAQLAVLSACSTVGLNRFDYDANLGFVTQFLHQGSGLVLASLWPIPDRATALFLAEFYRRLAAGDGIASALRNTKLNVLDTQPSAGVQWAAFQLFSQ